MIYMSVSYRNFCQCSKDFGLENNNRSDILQGYNSKNFYFVSRITDSCYLFRQNILGKGDI